MLHALPGLLAAAAASAGWTGKSNNCVSSGVEDSPSMQTDSRRLKTTIRRLRRDVEHEKQVCVFVVRQTNVTSNFNLGYSYAPGLTSKTFANALAPVPMFNIGIVQLISEYVVTPPADCHIRKLTVGLVETCMTCYWVNDHST